MSGSSQFPKNETARLDPAGSIRRTLELLTPHARKHGGAVDTATRTRPRTERSNTVNNKRLYRQGDVLVIPVDTIPTDGTKPVGREHGKVILAHGEVTGHHHAIVDDDADLVTTEQADELRMWLNITASGPVALTHQEHDTIMLPPGQYEVRRQREYTPERIVPVLD